MCKIARTLQLAARCIKLAGVVRVHGDGRGVQISELIQVASRQAAHDGSNKAGPSGESAALGAIASRLKRDNRQCEEFLKPNGVVWCHLEGVGRSERRGCVVRARPYKAPREVRPGTLCSAGREVSPDMD